MKKLIITLLFCFSLLQAEEVNVDRRENYFQTSTSYQIAPNVNPITGDLIQEEVDLVDAGVDTPSFPFEKHALSEETSRESPPAVFQPWEPTSVNPIVPKVNIITGEYCDEESDLVVVGAEPLSYRRFYGHQGYKDPVFGHWRINPETQISFNFELTKDVTRKFDKLIAIGKENGAFYLLDSNSGNTFSFNSNKYKTFTNHGLSGQTHPLNSKATFEIHKIKKSESRFYTGVIQDGDGRTREFITDQERWPSDKGGYGSNWAPPPYPGKIQKERRPNGNVIHYEYINYNNIKEVISSGKQYYILKSIKAYNSKEEIELSSIEIDYKLDSKKQAVFGIEVNGSDGRKAVLSHTHRKVRSSKHETQLRLYDIFLSNVDAPSKPNQSYDCKWEKAKRYYDHNFIYRASLSNGVVLNTAYTPDKKVSSQSAPVGSQGEVHPIASYAYYHGYTVVYDGENNKTIFHYNNDHRITAIEKFQGEQLYRVERTEWDSGNGNLLSKMIEDGSDNCIWKAEFKYDKNHNVKEEKIGDGHNDDIIYREFSSDGFNLLKKESYSNGKRIEYEYLPNTNLLVSEIVYDHRKILKRTFHFYDEDLNSVCIKSIIDDGGSKNPNDIKGITYRKIIEITPKKTQPCLGLPEEIREKTLDSFGSEILLKKVRYTYHPSGKVLKEEHYDANGNYRYTISNDYDDKECLIKTIDALGYETSYAYDANHNLTQIIGPKPGQRREFTYDQANRPIKIDEWQHDGTILTTRKEYDKLCRVIAETDPYGNKTHYTYDALSRVTSIQYPDGAIESKSYDVLGNVTSETDPNGYNMTKEYNFRGQPTHIYYPDGSEEQYTYYPNGTVAAHIDPNGVKTTYTYDIFDHPIKIEVYSSQGKLLKKTTATYSPLCKLSETDPLGVTTTYTYDYAGRKISEKRGEREVHYTYDEFGHLTQTREGDILTIEIYNDADQVVEKRIEDLKGEINFQEAYIYDEAGNRTQVITSEGTFTTQYDFKGQPIEKRDPLGHTTTITYAHHQGLTKTTTDPKGIKTVEMFDSRGRPIEHIVKNASGAIIQRREKRYDLAGNQTHSIEHIYEGPTLRETIINEWVYGPLGRVDQLIESQEKITYYLYDNAGRLITTIKPDQNEIHREYDSLGRLSRYYGSDLDYKYQYDAKDRLTQVDDKKRSTKRRYDIHDNLIEETLASGLTLKNKYDPFGRRLELQLPDKTTIYYIYKGPHLYSVNYKKQTHTYSHRNLLGQPTLITLPTSETLSIKRDPLNRWESIDSPYYKADYTYDSIGNLISYNFVDPLGQGGQTYTYDDLNQLISENDHLYQYDSLYNRTVKDQDRYALNSLSQVTSDGQKNYSYDLNGNLISDGESIYEYDILDRLIAVTTNNKRTTYHYDPFHRRISKDDQDYIWDGEHEIGMSKSGKIHELRVLGEGLGAEIGAAVIIELNGYTYFPIHDHRGSLVTLIYTNKKTYDSSRYTAFGEELTNARYCPWRFSSKRHDPETGFVCFGRRYYSPSLGRWATPDPQGFDDGPNLYAYVHNCPLTHFDLYGLWSNPFAGVRSFGGLVGRCTQFAFRGIEWTGANLIPVPGIQDFVESIGRWGAGGGFAGESRYRSNYNEIIKIPGIKIPGVSLTCGNGMLKNRDGAIEQGIKMSNDYGGAEVDLLYNASRGFLLDLLDCGLGKLGIYSPYEKMCASYYNRKLQDDPDHIFYTNVHSRGGIRLMNTGRMLTQEQRNHIHVNTFGSATMIPATYFGSAVNHVSPFDPVCMTNPLGYMTAIFSKGFNVNFLAPTSKCPYKEHGFLEQTYSNQLKAQGRDFVRDYLHK